MTANPTPVLGGSVLSEATPQDPRTDPLISEPTERGTPQATLVDALFAEDIARCRELLDIYPELVNTRLRHQGIRRTRSDDWAYGPTDRVGGYEWITPLVLISLAPRFREQNCDARKLSPASLTIMELLVERGAVLDLPRFSFWVSHLLTEVCRDYDSPEALDLLARAGADIYTQQLDDYGRTLLQVAAGRGVGNVRFLLDRGVPMNYTCSQDLLPQNDVPINGSPLNWAAENGRCQVVQLLLDHGGLVNIETLDRYGCTPLLNAARAPQIPCVRGHDREETVRLLVGAGANLTVSEQPKHKRNLIYGRPGPLFDSPLGHISAWGSSDIVRYLVSKGSDIHQQRSYPRDECIPYDVGGDKATPLHRAAYNWNTGAIQALLYLGADPDAMDEFGRRPIHWAAIGRGLGYRGRRTISETWDNLQTDPSQSVAFSERLAAVKSTLSYLLAHTASIDLFDTFGRTPLHYASYMKHTGAIILLIQHGADLCLPDADGRTFLHHLADPLYRPHVSYDIADATVKDIHLATTLAARLQNTSATNKSAILNHRDNTGATALHLAARSASDTVVALLLTLGADPDLTFPGDEIKGFEGERPDEGEGKGEGHEGVKEGRKNGRDATALHLAARRPVWLPSSFLSFNRQQYGAWSPRAARVKELLLGAGADASARDGKGMLAGEVEEESGAVIRKVRDKYLEWLTSPPEHVQQGIGRGRGRGRVGWGRGRSRGYHSSGSGTTSGAVPGPTTGNEVVDRDVGAGHGRGSGSQLAK